MDEEDNIQLYSDFIKNEVNVSSYGSWDLLMNCINRIENLGFVVLISSNNCYIQDIATYTSPRTLPKVMFDSYGKDKLEACYINICKFIKWYNGNNRS